MALCPVKENTLVFLLAVAIEAKWVGPGHPSCADRESGQSQSWIWWGQLDQLEKLDHCNSRRKWRYIWCYRIWLSHIDIYIYTHNDQDPSFGVNCWQTRRLDHIYRKQTLHFPRKAEEHGKPWQVMASSKPVRTGWEVSWSVHCAWACSLDRQRRSERGTFVFFPIWNVYSVWMCLIRFTVQTVSYAFVSMPVSVLLPVRVSWWNCMRFFHCYVFCLYKRGWI